MNDRIDELRATLQRDPKSRLFYQLGEMLRRNGDLTEAVDVLTAGLEHHPSYVAAWISLGRALQENGRHVQAAEALTRALKLDPENAVAARSLGFALIDLREWSRAVEVLERALVLVPGDDEIAQLLEHAQAHLAAASAEIPAPEEAGKSDAHDIAGTPAPAAEVEIPDVTGERPDDVMPLPHVSEPGGSPLQAASVVEVPGEDPFDVAPRGDTGVWVFGGDVFGTVVSEPERESGGSETVPAPAGGDEGVPLPTATLARLALEQNDVDLAERTARAVLERDPGSTTAQEVLAEVDRRRAVPIEEQTPAGRAALKVRALREWLDAVKLAAEKRVS